MTMNKSTTKRLSYNEDILNRLADKYGVTKRFIIMSIKGDRESETSESIKKDYKKMDEAISAIDKARNKEIEEILKCL